MLGKIMLILTISCCLIGQPTYADVKWLKDTDPKNKELNPKKATKNHFDECQKDSDCHNCDPHTQSPVCDIDKKFYNQCGCNAKSIPRKVFIRKCKTDKDCPSTHDTVCNPRGYCMPL